MRFLFCVLPALMVAIIFTVFHPILGVVFGVGMFGLGWQVTEPRGKM
mgnify:CR=1 FL=1